MNRNEEAFCISKEITLVKGDNSDSKGDNSDAWDEIRLSYIPCDDICQSRVSIDS